MISVFSVAKQRYFSIIDSISVLLILLPYAVLLISVTYLFYTWDGWIVGSISFRMLRCAWLLLTRLSPKLAL